MIPQPVRRALNERLREESPGEGEIGEGTRVSGGSINRAARIRAAPHGNCFLKWNSEADPDMFEKEVRGLKLLRSAGSNLRLPRPLLRGEADGTGYLLMEFVEEGSPGQSSAGAFGRSLAALHGVSQENFGLDHDNYIGKLPQSNTPHAEWNDFFREERLEPQVRRAVDAGLLPGEIRDRFRTLYRRMDELIPPEPPALIHGDLWGGNYFYDTSGEAVVYDPAVYYGHREIELAFTHLFGGFSRGFYDAYEEARPLEPGFSERRELYNLYPLLVHTNLFGASYARRVEAIMRRF